MAAEQKWKTAEEECYRIAAAAHKEVNHCREFPSINDDCVTPKELMCPGRSQRMWQVLFIEPSKKCCCEEWFGCAVLTFQTTIMEHLMGKRQNDTNSPLMEQQHCMAQEGQASILTILMEHFYKAITRTKGNRNLSDSATAFPLFLGHESLYNLL